MAPCKQSADHPAEEPAPEGRADSLLQKVQGSRPGKEGGGTLLSEHTKANFEKGSSEKQELAQRNERLDRLKAKGGPFTESGEVEQFLTDPTLDDKGKQQWMKLEVHSVRQGEHHIAPES